MSNQDTHIRTKRRIVVSVTPVINAVAYANGDQIGGINLMQFTVPTLEADQSVIDAITVVDKADQRATLDFLFFAQDPTSVITSVNNAAFAITDAGTDLIQHVARLLNIDYTDLGPNAFGEIECHIPLKANPGSRDFYVVTIIRTGSSYAVGDLTYNFHIDQS